MCGIVGWFDIDKRGRTIAPDVFDAAVDSLAHRGPNDRGTWFADGVALGHRRLSIIDLSSAARQPMVSEDGRFVLTYNGEIYNYRELREELCSAGHRFRTQSDTEVVLAGFREWGRAVVRRLNGIFALGIVDTRRHTLFLARDRLGVKPLYYSHSDGVFRFASQPRALLVDASVSRTPDIDAVNQFLTLGYVAAPASGFAAVRQLEPANWMQIDANGLHTRCYWCPVACTGEYAADAAAAEFGDRLALSVRRQLVADVPVGAFLSGGLDSTAIVAKMAREAPSTQAFTVCFSESSFDESERAAATADHLGIELTAPVLADDLDGLFDAYMQHCDDLFADSSALAVFALCREAARHVRVVLSGDGADELLGGYSTYTATHWARLWRRVPRWLRSSARSAAQLLPAQDQRYNLSQFVNRFLRGAEAGAGRDFASWRTLFWPEDRARILRPEWLALRDPYENYAIPLHAGKPPTLKQMLLADLNFYLPSDMLTKVDRMSMAHGLEVRVPFLDHEFVEFCLTLPDRLLVPSWLRGARGNKAILRNLVSREVGPATARRKKTGFNVPIEKAMRGSLGRRLLDEVHSEPFRSSGPLRVDQLTELWRAHERRQRDAGHALYAALVLASWWNRSQRHEAGSGGSARMIRAA